MVFERGAAHARLSFWLPIIINFPWISSTKIGSYLSALFEGSIITYVVVSSSFANVDSCGDYGLTLFEIANGHRKMLLTGPQHYWVVQSVEISCPSAVRKPLFFSLSLRVFLIMMGLIAILFTGDRYDTLVGFEKRGQKIRFLWANVI
jgi:hypothetical protein